ncbi:MAG: hypothetical protein LBT75_01290 [Bacilli bacterium]|nr:hypothetical protein [Bacilli bacterium]
MKKMRIVEIVFYPVITVIVVFMMLIGIYSTISAMEIKKEVVNSEANKSNEISNIKVRANLNSDFYIKTIKDEINAGDVASFNLYLKITGSNTILKNAKLEIILPNAKYLNFKQNLDELIIAKVKPTLKNNRLVWDFKSLKAGVMDKIVLKINTANGISPDGHKVMINGQFSADNLVDDNDKTDVIKDSADIKIKANGKLAATNYFKNVLDTNFISPSQGDEAIWEFSLSVPKLASGSKYLKEGSIIKVEYEIDKFITYQGVANKTPQPTTISKNNDGSTLLVWEFKAPQYELQDQDLKHIFEQNFQLQLYFPIDIPQFQIVTNKVVGSVVFFDETNAVSTSLKSSIIVLSSNPSAIASNGSSWAISGKSPIDSVGGVSGNNQDIKVYDSALLGFGISANMGLADSATYGPTKYYLTYDVDDHLDIYSFYSGDFYYRPNSKFPAGLQFKKELIYDIYVKYGTKNNQEQDYSLFLENVTPGKWYRNFNTKGKHISEIQIRFHANDQTMFKEKLVPAGLFTTNLSLYFSIEKNYVGPVVNRIKDVEITEGWDGDNYGRPDYGEDKTPWPAAYKAYWGPYSAQVMPMPTGETKVARTGIKFSNTTGNLIEEGHNVLNVSITNDVASIANLNAPFESYILLPIGCYLEDEQEQAGNYIIIKESDNYQNTKQQLVKVIWSNTKLLPSTTLNAFINVNISNKITNVFKIKVDSFIGNQDFIVHKITSQPSLIDSFKIKDVEDLNNNGNSDEYIVSSGNEYVTNGKHILEVSQSSLVNKKQNYEFNEVNLNEMITYQFILNNASNDNINKLILVDVLPSLNDKSITTLENRNSKFSLQLKGPIIIPQEWKNKVVVQYSTSLNPKLAGLIDKNTTYYDNMNKFQDNKEASEAVWLNEDEIVDWSKIYSFKIESKPDIDYLKCSSAIIEINMITPGLNGLEPSLLDKSINKEQRAAYNSFAIATNDSQAVELNKYGVSLRLDDGINKDKPNQGNVVSKPTAKDKANKIIKKNKLLESKIPNTGMNNNIFIINLFL